MVFRSNPYMVHAYSSTLFLFNIVTFPDNSKHDETPKGSLFTFDITSDFNAKFSMTSVHAYRNRFGIKHNQPINWQIVDGGGEDGFHETDGRV